MFVRINGEETRYKESLQTFTTQHGHEAIRFVGDPIPETNKGFKAYDSTDREVADLSKYTYPYGPNEYTTVADELEPVEPGTSKPLPESPLDVRLDQMNRRISAITPYEQTKTAYFGEVEKVFYGVPQGNTTVFFDKYEGAYEISRIEDRLTVSFPERLQDMTNITIMVQQ